MDQIRTGIIVFKFGKLVSEKLFVSKPITISGGSGITNACNVIRAAICRKTQAFLWSEGEPNGENRNNEPIIFTITKQMCSPTLLPLL